MEKSHSYWICFTPRTGSYLLSHLLSATRLAGFPEEYFWKENEASFAHAWQTDGSFDTYLSCALSASRTPNGVSGLKIGSGYHLSHFLFRLRTLGKFAGRDLSERSMIDAVFPDNKFIWLTRRNKVRQAISWWRAVQDNVWKSSPSALMEPARAVEYDFVAIDFFCHKALLGDAAWAEFFAERKIVPLTIVYEDMIEDFSDTVQRIFAYLGISYTDRYELPVTPTSKRADSLNDEWVARYRREKQAGWPEHAW